MTLLIHIAQRHWVFNLIAVSLDSTIWSLDTNTVTDAFLLNKIPIPKDNTKKLKALLNTSEKKKKMKSSTDLKEENIHSKSDLSIQHILVSTA